MNTNRPTFISLPVHVLVSENFRQLSGSAVRLLLDACISLRLSRGRPTNNGQLVITRKRMSALGWTSQDLLYSAKNELLHYGFLKVARTARYQAQSHLYAVTFFRINECVDIDIASTLEAPDDWQRKRRPFKRKANKRNESRRNVVPFIGTRNQPVIPDNIGNCA